MPAPRIDPRTLTDRQIAALYAMLLAGIRIAAEKRSAQKKG